MDEARTEIESRGRRTMNDEGGHRPLYSSGLFFATTYISAHIGTPAGGIPSSALENVVLYLCSINTRSLSTLGPCSGKKLPRSLLSLSTTACCRACSWQIDIVASHRATEPSSVREFLFFYSFPKKLRKMSSTAHVFSIELQSSILSVVRFQSCTHKQSSSLQPRWRQFASMRI